MTYLIFKDRATRDAVVDLIPKTMFGLVKMKEEPYAPAAQNIVPAPEGADGRVMTSHPFCQDDRDNIEMVLAEWIAEGKVQVLEKMPEDWVSKEGEG